MLELPCRGALARIGVPGRVRRTTIAALVAASSALAAASCGTTESAGASEPAPDTASGDALGDGGADAVDDTSDDAPDDAPDDADREVAVDVANDPDGDPVTDTDVDAGCTGPEPMCTFGCGGDAFMIPDCEAGAWRCPEGTIPMDECPPGSCFGLPYPGEVCDEGWQCRPWERGSLPACDAPPAQLCADCRGFEDAYATDGCECTCDGGFVQCGAPPECRVGEASTDFGITIRVELDRCAFTLAELRAGVVLGYTVELEDLGKVVWSQPLDAGSCDRPGASGLRLLERVSGGEHSWCVCDEGLCFPAEPEYQRLTPGTYEGGIEWDGRNWFGPSDFGSEPGDPFPAGEYLFSVRAAGLYGDAPGDGLAWDITATAPIYVLE